MVETFAQHWPVEVELLVYAEGFDVDVVAPNVIERRLPDWHTAWKAKHANNLDAHGRDKSRFGRNSRIKNRPYDFLRDCVRFSHKVAALTDAAGSGPGWLIMCDADVVTHEPVTTDWLSSLITDPAFYVAWLDRTPWYPECGFVVFNEAHREHTRFMDTFRSTYESDRVFAMSETHDSFVLQQVAMNFIRLKLIKPVFNLSTKAGSRSSHPFVHSRLAERLDHAKGKFKAGGRTPRGFVHRKEAHWQ